MKTSSEASLRNQLFSHLTSQFATHRFNRTYREEVVDVHLFDSLSHVSETMYPWLQTYNETRPHDALGRVPPSSSGDGWRHCKTPLLTCLLAAEDHAIRKRQ